MASSRLVLPCALAPSSTRPVAGSSQSRSERFRNPRATRWRSRTSWEGAAALLDADLPTDGAALLTEHVDTVHPEDHGRAEQVQRRELQRELHRVPSLALDRRKALIGPADLEVHRVHPVGV